jgi:hypothetical protein
VFQISFPTSTNFLRSFLTLYLFSLSGNLFSKFFENEKGLTSGTHRSATASHGVAPRLAIVSGTACHHVHGYKGTGRSRPCLKPPPVRSHSRSEGIDTAPVRPQCRHLSPRCRTTVSSSFCHSHPFLPHRSPLITLPPPQQRCTSPPPLPPRPSPTAHLASPPFRQLRPEVTIVSIQ